MRRKPRELLYLSIFFATVAASFPIQVMVSYGYSPLELGAILNGLAPLNWAVIFIALGHAWLLYQASQWVLFTSVLFLLTVFWNNWIVAGSGMNASAIAVTVSSLGAILAHLPLLKAEIRRTLLNPNLQWWNTPPRKKACVRAIIRPVLGGELRTRTFDVSSGGIFITLDGAAWTPGKNMPLRQLQEGSRCSVRLMIDQLHIVNCGAVVVRRTPARGAYPAGYGIKFVCMDREQQKILESFMDQVPSVADTPVAMAA